MLLLAVEYVDEGAESRRATLRESYDSGRGNSSSRSYPKDRSPRIMSCIFSQGIVENGSPARKRAWTTQLDIVVHSLTFSLVDEFPYEGHSSSAIFQEIGFVQLAGLHLKRSVCGPVGHALAETHLQAALREARVDNCVPEHFGVMSCLSCDIASRQPSRSFSARRLCVQVLESARGITPAVGVLWPARLDQFPRALQLAVVLQHPMRDPTLANHNHQRGSIVRPHTTESSGPSLRTTQNSLASDATTTSSGEADERMDGGIGAGTQSWVASGVAVACSPASLKLDLHWLRALSSFAGKLAAVVSQMRRRLTSDALPGYLREKEARDAPQSLLAVRKSKADDVPYTAPAPVLARRTQMPVFVQDLYISAGALTLALSNTAKAKNNKPASDLEGGLVV